MNNIDTNSQEVIPSADVTSPQHFFFVDKEEYLFYQVDGFRKNTCDSRLKGDRRFALSLIRYNQTICCCRESLSCSPLPLPSVSLHYVPCFSLVDRQKIKMTKNHHFLCGWLSETLHKQPAHSVQHVVLSLYEPLAPTATSGQPTPNQPRSPRTLPPWNYFCHSAEKPAQTSQPAIICMQVSPGWSRAKGSSWAVAYSRRPLVCRSHAPRPRQTQSYDASGSRRMAQNEWIMSRAGGKQPASLPSWGGNAKSVHRCFRGHIFLFSSTKLSCSVWKGLPSSLD